MSNWKVSLISQVRGDLWLPAFPMGLQLNSVPVTQRDLLHANVRSLRSAETCSMSLSMAQFCKRLVGF